MPQYFVAGYLPDDFDPSTMDESVGPAIHALNQEMIAAGVRKFACGLGATKSLQKPTDGQVVVTDGPYLETKEVIGGFWVIDAPDLDVALKLAAEGSKACGGKVEVRPFDGLA